MNIKTMLDRPIAYHRVFVSMTGSVKAAILLSQAVYWQARAKQEDGWWYKSAEEWEEETGLTRREQEKARKDAEQFLKTDLRGVPATLYWHVDEGAIEAFLFSDKGESSFDKKVKLDSTKSENINKNTETTAENTSQEISQTSKIEKRGDLVQGFVDFAQMPGAKKAVRLDALASLIKVRFGIEPTRRKWIDFLNYADKAQQERGESVVVFFDWLEGQKNFDISFWPPDKMQENWSRAFMQSIKQETPIIRAADQTEQLTTRPKGLKK